MWRSLLKNNYTERKYVGIMSTVTQVLAHVSGSDSIELAIVINWLPYRMDKLIILQNFNDNSTLNGYWNNQWSNNY